VPEWLCLLRPGRDDLAATMTDVERDVWGRHARRLADDVRGGDVILAGPALGRTNVEVVIFEADDEQSAWAYVRGDPTVSEGHVTPELMAMRVSFLRGRPESGS
jgi:uncharacterized protein YciI